mgnify:CR=1 FL=1
MLYHAGASVDKGSVKTTATGAVAPSDADGKPAAYNKHVSDNAGVQCVNGEPENPPGCSLTTVTPESAGNMFTVICERNIPGISDLTTLPPDTIVDKVSFVSSMSDGAIYVGKSFEVHQKTQDRMCVTRDNDGTIQGHVELEVTVSIPISTVQAADSNNKMIEYDNLMPPTNVRCGIHYATDN